MKSLPITLLLLIPTLTSAGTKDLYLDQISILAGGGGGYHRVVSSTPAELDKHGYQLDASALLAYSSQRWTIDLGAGWLYNRSKETSDSTTLVMDSLSTKAPFGTIGGRYRFTPSWELGLRNRILFAADTRFQTAAPQDDHVNWLLGPELAYRFPTRILVQLTGGFLTDATISGRQLYQFFVGLHVGLPIFDLGSKPTPTPTPTPSPTPTPTPEPTASPTPPPPSVVIVEKRSYHFDAQRIEFDFNKDTLRPRSKELLKDLGQFLSKNSDAWKSLEVEGHTDSRGSAAYNKNLSQRRAESVRRELIANGLPAERVSAQGFGFSNPIASGKTESAYQRNRRVEFTFLGISKPELLDEFIRKLNRDY